MCSVLVCVCAAIRWCYFTTCSNSYLKRTVTRPHSARSVKLVTSTGRSPKLRVNSHIKSSDLTQTSTMTKERKRDRLLRRLRFWQSTPPTPDAVGSPSSSTVTSSTTVSTSPLRPGPNAEICTPHTPSTQLLTSQTSLSVHSVDTDADVSIATDSSLRSEPMSATSTSVGTERSEAVSEIEAASSASKAEPQPLWVQAFSQLSAADRETLTPFVPKPGCGDTTTSVVEGIRTQMKQAMASKRDRAWKVTWRGDVIVLQDVAMKIIQWVDKFKQIGDIVVQYDPGHAALPWAAFRFLLQVCIIEII
jgi:hypothetical protein